MENVKKSGSFIMEGFVIFEAIRNKKKDGGTLIGVKKDLKPMLIKEYSETFERITVEVTVWKKDIRSYLDMDHRRTGRKTTGCPSFLL